MSRILDRQAIRAIIRLTKRERKASARPAGGVIVAHDGYAYYCNSLAALHWALDARISDGSYIRVETDKTHERPGETPALDALKSINLDDPEVWNDAGLPEAPRYPGGGLVAGMFREHAPQMLTAPRTIPFDAGMFNDVVLALGIVGGVSLLPTGGDGTPFVVRRLGSSAPLLAEGLFMPTVPARR